ncbi:hypothetical protein [Chitinimonas koreensis]|uniref:hypothetical protein n=1 Tax=Chitinimonas koreensis TaxID=356302 RepID=UPI00068745EF|nr:hypothetical protein [Chitinimonas koreensis]QNM97658.1 hypothetical protein H9L41_04990 [Chitinimonas koreensis]
MRRLILRLLLLVASAAGLAGAEPMRYVLPAPEGAADKRYEYYQSLLAAALEATRDKWGDYVLERHDLPMNAARATAEMLAGHAPTVLVRTTSVELEKTLRPIRIPLDKGLTGYRLFLIMQPTQARLDGVHDLAALRRFSIGQEVRWTDVGILRAAGFEVVTGDGYAGLFGMLRAGRFALFSRGANEIAAELASHAPQLPGLAIERQLLLYYPLPRYFFVAPDEAGRRLGERIEDGLRQLIRSGEFDRRYRVYKRDVLGGVKLNGRRLFRIPNPTLPAETPLDDPALWDDLRDEIGGNARLGQDAR